MTKRLGLAVAVLAGTAVAASSQEQDFSKVEITTQKVADGVYMLQGAGGNLGLSVGADGAFLIDDQFAPLTEKIVSAVKNVTDQPIQFVLNTHWHFDHTGGNENLGKAGALIVAHDNVRRRMSTEQFLEFFGRRIPAAPQVALPVVTFDRTVTFHINGDELHALHVARAHTDGDSVVHFRRADVIHTGDVFFNGIYPFIDVGAGGGIQGMIAAADRILAMTRDTTKIIPGHGPLATRAELVAFRDMLAAVRDAIQPMVAAGKTLDEVTAAKPTAALDAKWGGGFLKPDQFATLVYTDLSRAEKD